MSYTITEFEDAVIVRAELRTLADYNELIKKLLDRRDRAFPYPQKEEKK